MQRINVKIEWCENNYTAFTENSELLNGIVVATATTINEIKKEIISAIKFHIDGCIQDGDKLTENIKSGEYEIEYNLETSALLHSLDGILTRSALSRATGINEKLIGHYASGYRNPRNTQRQKIIHGIHHISRELATIM
jgi:predicted RNase H-like HicB family nuclease